MNGVTNGIFQTHIVATGVHSLLAEKERPNLSESDIKNIKKIGKDKEVFELLGPRNEPLNVSCQKHLRLFRLNLHKIHFRKRLFRILENKK